MLATAAEHARDVSAALAEHVDAGRDVVVVEPSDLAMFRGDYERFLPERAAERLADASYDALEYVHGLLANGASVDALAPPAGDGRVAYHSHCQARTLDVGGHARVVLERAGYDVVTSDVECCGMAGSFGYKSDYYELSVAVGDRLREQFRADGTRDRVVVATGTSCLDQLDSLLARRPRHPLELLDPGR
jgi:Fe-S oxidoreductase